MLRERCLSHLMDIYGTWPLMGNFLIWTHSGLIRTGSPLFILIGLFLNRTPLFFIVKLPRGDSLNSGTTLYRPITFLVIVIRATRVLNTMCAQTIPSYI
jgi:hypothetical protein